MVLAPLDLMFFQCSGVFLQPRYRAADHRCKLPRLAQSNACQYASIKFLPYCDRWIGSRNTAAMTIQKLRKMMKTLKCDLCDVTAEGETFEEWMNALRPHYMEAHADVMNDPSHGQEQMEKWMAENKVRFEAA